MNSQLKRTLQVYLTLMDVAAVNLSFIANFLLLQNQINQLYINDFIQLGLLSNTAWLMMAFLSGLYRGNTISHFEPFIRNTLRTFVWWTIAIISYAFFVQIGSISRIFVASFIFLFGAGLFFNRFLYIGMKRYLKRKFFLLNKSIILGYNETALKLAAYFEEDAINTHLIGFVEDTANIQELTPYPILGEIKDSIELASAFQVQEIYSTIVPEENTFIYQVMKEAEKRCIHFKIVPNLSAFINKPVVVHHIRDLPVLTIRNEPLEDLANRMYKRIFDLTISGLVLVCILSWLIPLVGLLIISESKGPIFFLQKRTGRRNRSFNCLKFRSMRLNHEADQVQASRSDQRITRMGKFLRKTSLDEFPQFINVFRGDMSIVGPRPHMLKHTEDYSKLVDAYMIRHFLKPGITGWAQIKGYRGEITDPIQIKMRVANDLWYLENWNVWLDIKIVFLTMYNVLKGDEHAF